MIASERLSERALLRAGKFCVFSLRNEFSRSIFFCLMQKKKKCEGKDARSALSFLSVHKAIVGEKMRENVGGFARILHDVIADFVGKLEREKI
jgi:hypothetical protein